MRISSLKGAIKRRLRRMSNAQALQEDAETFGDVIVDGKGHREYVGGLWHAIGARQFRFMVDEGLEPHHVLLDVACGSLRAGVRFIPYLQPGNYLGIEIRRELIEAGIKSEIGQKLYDLKKPEFVVSGTFEFSRFSKQPDFALAQSLFTHLIADDIDLCLRNLRAFAKPNAKLFATFAETDAPYKNPDRSHPHQAFFYTRSQMLGFGKGTGWTARYIGDWRHPRGGAMVEYRPR